jgi:hypothetical protein
VLASLRDALKLEYRTSIQLDQSITGTYQGSLQRVLTRVLDGYDFILKNSSEKIELVVLGRKGSGGPSQPSGDPVVNTDQLASQPANTKKSEDGKSAAAKAATPQKAQQATVPSMLTILAQQQIPGAGGSAPTSASAPSSGSSNGGGNGGGGSSNGSSSGSAGTVPTQAEIAALTQQAAGKLEALRSSLQRVGR